MNKLHIEIPLSIIWSGCNICLISVLFSFTPYVDYAIVQSMYKVGVLFGLVGVEMGLMVYCWYKLMPGSTVEI